MTLTLHPKPASALLAREALRTAWKNQPAETPGPFGITTRPGRRGNNSRRSIVFDWRNYLTGTSGHLATAYDDELFIVTQALLDEIQALRARAHKKLPEKESGNGHKGINQFRTARAGGG